MCISTLSTHDAASVTANWRQTTQPNSGRHENDVVEETAMALDGREVMLSFKPQPEFLEGKVPPCEARRGPTTRNVNAT